MNLKKDLAVVGGLFLLVVVLLVFGRGFTSTSYIGQRKEATQGTQAAKNSTAPAGKTRLTIKNLTVFVDVAKTSKERQKGLSGRDSLPFSEGLLFVFDTPDKYNFWMKDMKFPIDIVWVGPDKKIVDIAADAVPEPGKKDSELKIYRPQSAALYVLEINGGQVKLNDLKAGDSVNF